MSHEKKKENDIDKTKELSRQVFCKGFDYYSEGKYEEAIEQFSKAISIDENYKEAFFGRGNSYLENGSNKEAIENYNSAINLDKNYIDAIVNRALVYEMEEKYEEAIKDYDNIIRLDSKNKENFYDRGRCYYYQRKYKEARHDFNTVIELDSKYKYAFIMIGRSYYEEKRYVEAIKQFTYAINLDNNDILSLLARGTIYDILGRYKEARDDFDYVINIDSNNRDAYFNKGVTYYHQGKYREAIIEFNSTISIDSKDSEAFVNRGLCYMGFRKYEEAVEDFKIAIQINNNSIDSYVGIKYMYNYNMNEISSELQREIKEMYIQFEKISNYKDFDPYITDKIQNIKDAEMRKYLDELYVEVTKMKSSIKYETQGEELGHYTKIQNLKFLIKRDSLGKDIDNKNTLDKGNCFLRLNNIEYMNDPDEGNIFIKLLSDINKEKEEFLDTIYNISQSNCLERREIKGEGNIFLASLSRNIDNSLPMWRQYANDGDGCCLVFDSKFFKENLESNTKLDSQEGVNIDNLPKNINMDGLYNVIYTKEDGTLESNHINNSIKSIAKTLNKIFDLIHKNKDKDDVYTIIRVILDNVRFLFKDSTYAYEKEVRLLRFEDIEDEKNEKVKCTSDVEGFVVPHLYVEFEKDIRPKEIILGPKVADERGVANYIRYTKKADKITKSKIRYK